MILYAKTAKKIETTNMKVDKKHSIAYLKTIKYSVQNYFDLDISSNKRHRDYIYARFVYCKLAREFISLSFEKIGKEINRTHANVIYALKEIENIFNHDKTVLKSYEFILNRFNKKRTEQQKYYEAMKLAIYYRQKYLDTLT